MYCVPVITFLFSACALCSEEEMHNSKYLYIITQFFIYKCEQIVLRTVTISVKGRALGHKMERPHFNPENLQCLQQVTLFTS
jgi:hypothetical protein